MTSIQVVETSVTTTDNSPSRDYTHTNDQVTPEFKPFDLLYFIDQLVKGSYWDPEVSVRISTKTRIRYEHRRKYCN